MGDIVHLPIRRVGDFQLDHESVYTTIGTAQIVTAQIVTVEGPETWCAVLRRDVFPDALLFTVQVGERESFERFFTELLGTIEAALRLACLNMDALLNEGENMYGR